MICNVQLPLNIECKMPLFVIMIAYQHFPKIYHSPNGRENYQWYFCVKGKGEVYINHQRTVISENDGFLIYPNAAYSLREITTDWELDFIDFNGAICPMLLSALNMENGDIVHFQNKNYFHDKIKQIYELFLQKLDAKEEILSKVCYEFLLDLHRYRLQIPKQIESGEQEDDVIIKITSYFERHFSEMISLDDLAEYMGLSKRYLCTLYKQKMQITLLQELTNIRIGHARIYLKQYPDKNIAEIARMCGFEQAGYFGKVFKKITGETPDKFRKR